MTTPGEICLSLSLAADKVTGELSSPMGAVPVTGTATGNDVALTAELSVQGMNLEFAITGKVDGDAIAGNVKVGDFGEFPFTGKRVAKTAAAAPAAAAPAAAAGGPITDLNGKWNITLSIAMGEIRPWPTSSRLETSSLALSGPRRPCIAGTRRYGGID